MSAALQKRSCSDCLRSASQQRGTALLPAGPKASQASEEIGLLTPRPGIVKEPRGLLGRLGMSKSTAEAFFALVDHFLVDHLGSDGA